MSPGRRVTVNLGFGFMGPLWGAHHETYTSVPHDGVQLPPTQGHDRDMGNTPNTAAIYVRRSAAGERDTNDPESSTNPTRLSYQWT